MTKQIVKFQLLIKNYLNKYNFESDFQVYNVFMGNQLTMKKDLHERIITGLTFFNPLKYLITGAKDGSSMYFQP